MKMLKYTSFALALMLTFNACEQEIAELKAPDIVEPEPDCPDDASAGSADFTKYVAIGNSLTAGFQAGALFTEGQENSLGNILATQFACVGGGAFNQPDINSENGFFTGGTNPVGGTTYLGRLLLQGTPPAPAPTISNAAAAPSPLNPAFAYTGDKAALNNFAVPGIQIGQIFLTETGDWTKLDMDPGTAGLQTHPAFNPYYARFAKVSGTSTILTDAMGALANGGTFFSFWLGANDVLGYAVGGGANPAIFTSEADFNTRFNGAINTLLSVPNVKGVIGNIPNVLAIPYFRLVPYNAIPLDEATVGALNPAFAGYNQIVTGAGQAARKIEFAVGQNPVVISDESLSDLEPVFAALRNAGQINEATYQALLPYRRAREATAADLFTLSAATVLGTTVGGNPQAIIGVTVPLSDQYVLIPSEQAEIVTRVGQFNAIIATKVSSSERLALADVNTVFNQLLTAGAQSIDNLTVIPTLAPPFGIFSEDGVHPNSRGTAYMANVFIDAINAKFGAKVPKAKLTKYQGTGLPVNP